MYLLFRLIHPSLMPLSVKNVKHSCIEIRTIVLCRRDGDEVVNITLSGVTWQDAEGGEAAAEGMGRDATHDLGIGLAELGEDLAGTIGRRLLVGLGQTEALQEGILFGADALVGLVVRLHFSFPL